MRDDATWDAVEIILKAMTDVIWDDKYPFRTSAILMLSRMYTHLTFAEFALLHGYVKA